MINKPAQIRFLAPAYAADASHVPTGDAAPVPAGAPAHVPIPAPFPAGDPGFVPAAAPGFTLHSDFLPGLLQFLQASMNIPARNELHMSSCSGKIQIRTLV